MDVPQTKKHLGVGARLVVAPGPPRPPLTRDAGTDLRSEMPRTHISTSSAVTRLDPLKMDD